MKYRRFQDIALTSVAIGCLFGFFTLLVQPDHWFKGMLLGSGTGACMSCAATKERAD